MRFGIVVFPGTWSDRDCHSSLGSVLGQDVGYVWHKERDVSSFDCLILPGGFSYGDYLRAGAIARFSPVMQSLPEYLDKGGLVLGICNGFQILCEAGFLPGVLMRNDCLEFRCQWVNLKVENSTTVFSAACQTGQILRMPISHGEGRYYADPATLNRLEDEQRVVLRYCDLNGKNTYGSNPNGSFNNIAGIINRDGNVMGLMPHPERACEELLGGVDGALFFQSLIRSRCSSPI